MKKLVLCLALIFVPSLALAQSGSAPAPVLVDAGVPTAAPAAPLPPADQLHDPTAAPGSALSDLEQAKRAGWSLAILAGLFMACKLASSWSVLSFLNKGRTAIIIGTLGALAAGAYNALAGGGSWFAALSAAFFGAAGYYNTHNAA
jgi:hypothetical protein